MLTDRVLTWHKETQGRVGVSVSFLKGRKVSPNLGWNLLTLHATELKLTTHPWSGLSVRSAWWEFGSMEKLVILSRSNEVKLWTQNSESLPLTAVLYGSTTPKCRIPDPGIREGPQPEESGLCSSGRLNGAGSMASRWMFLFLCSVWQNRKIPSPVTHLYLHPSCRSVGIFSNHPWVKTLVLALWTLWVE